jgi:hypothetical protein
LSSKENKTTTQVNIAISVDKNIKQETIDVKTDNNVKTVNSGRNEPKSRDKNGDLCQVLLSSHMDYRHQQHPFLLPRAVNFWIFL